MYCRNTGKSGDWFRDYCWNYSWTWKWLLGILSSIPRSSDWSRNIGKSSDLATPACFNLFCVIKTFLQLNKRSGHGVFGTVVGPARFGVDFCCGKKIWCYTVTLPSQVDGKPANGIFAWNSPLLNRWDGIKLWFPYTVSVRKSIKHTLHSWIQRGREHLRRRI